MNVNAGTGGRRQQQRLRGATSGYTYTSPNAGDRHPGQRAVDPRDLLAGKPGASRARTVATRYTGALRLLDAQPGTAETSTLTGNVVLWNNNPWIGVDGAEDKLVLGGTGMVSSSELTYVWFASQPTNPWSLTYSGQTANLAGHRHRRPTCRARWRPSRRSVRAT